MSKENKNQKPSIDKSQSQVENESLIKENYKSKDNRDIVWAIFMISIGVVFLMNSFGIISWAIWTILWRFWPVLMILGGLQLLLGKNMISRVVIGIIALISINLIILFSALSLNHGFGSWVKDIVGARVYDWGSSYINQERENITLRVTEDEITEDIISRNIDLDIDFSEFTISTVDSKDPFLVDSIYYENVSKPEVLSSYKNDILDIDFVTESQPGHWFGNYTDIQHNIMLGANEVETDITIELGAGNGEIYLDEINLNNLDINVGAGSVVVDLTKESLPSEVLNIEVGAGSVNVKVPKDVSLKIDYDLGAGEIDIADQEIQGLGKNGSYVSEGYDDAEYVIEMILKVGAGKVFIESD